MFEHQPAASTFGAGNDTNADEQLLKPDIGKLLECVARQEVHRLLIDAVQARGGPGDQFGGRVVEHEGAVREQPHTRPARVRVRVGVLVDRD